MTELTLQYPKTGSGRISVLDELRGFAILLVVMYHVGGVTGFGNYMHGDLGVDIFVMLSGAALAISNRESEGPLSFLYRRLVRLLPAYWIVLTAFAWGNQYFLNLKINTQSLIAHYLCVHEMWGDRYFLDYNDSFWFLALALLLYIVFAALRKILHRMDIVLGIGLSLSFLGAWVTYAVNQPATFVHLGLRPSIFFVGIPFGLLLKRGEVKIPMTPWFAIGIMASLYGLFVTGLLVGYTMCGFSLCIAYFAARVSAESAGPRPLCRLMAWLGKYSFEIFLIHQPLIRNYNTYFLNRFLGAPTEEEKVYGLVVALLLTVYLSVKLHKFCNWLGTKLLPKTVPLTTA